MPDLYGTGCSHCCPEIAAVQAMPTYLDVDGYIARYHALPLPWPKPYIDGAFMAEVTGTVAGEDGWLICNAPVDSLPPDPKVSRAMPCPCGSGNLYQQVWRGKVEIR
jgi:hypothetical protein